jgi:hypothetical protein
MKRNIQVFAFILLAIAAASMPVVLVVAQEEVVPMAPEATFGWVVLSWLIYAVAGLLASMTSAESFDTIKFARSVIIMLLTGAFALAFRISPANIQTEFGGVITILANTIVNAAPGVTLIYLIDKVWKLIANLKTKIEAARALSSPGPPKP